MMLGTTFVATVYLIICHVALNWDNAECVSEPAATNSQLMF